MKKTMVFSIFSSLSTAILKSELIHRVSKSDKEFHFQNWFEDRLKKSKILFDKGGRNSYPDFKLVEFQEGYEIKGLAYPGREMSYDCNSQPPSGFSNGREVFYVFGRYPPLNRVDDEYPVIDLVICHGDFLNANHNYVHRNRSIKGFGSYGDIMVRDRKMYVAPTPYAIVDGFIGRRTLVIPEDWDVPHDLKLVGHLNRTETEKIVVGYSFDLIENTITPVLIPNPHFGTVHSFCAYRMINDSSEPVSCRTNENTKFEEELD